MDFMKMSVTIVLRSALDIKDYIPYKGRKISQYLSTWQRSAVGNMSGNRCESDCRSRDLEFDPGLVPYFRGD